MIHQAYWISPTGSIIPVEGTADRHIHVVIQNPEKFGYTLDEIKTLHKKYKEPLGSEGKAREEIMVDLIKQGWIRIRYYDKLYQYSIQVNARNVSNMTSRQKESIWDWAMLITRGRENKKENNLKSFKLSNVDGDVLIHDGQIKDIVQFSKIFGGENESWNESKKYNRVYVDRFCLIKDYNPQLKEHEKYIDKLLK